MAPRKDGAGAPQSAGRTPATAAPAAPPTTMWDRLNAAAAAKTPAERQTAMSPIVAEIATKRDINPLLQVLKDTRPLAQKAAIAGLFYPEIKALYWTSPDWRGIVASAIAGLFASADIPVAMTATAAVRELVDDGQVDAASLARISEAVKLARTKAPGEVSLTLSFIVIKLRSLGIPCE